MYNLQSIENRIAELAKQQGLSKNKLLINANLNKSLFDNMKKGQIPSIEKIHILADYLDCSVDYLLGRSTIVRIEKDLQDKEKRLLSAYREQPGVQLAVDRLLGIDVPLHFPTETKLAAFGGSQTTTTADIHKAANILSEIEGEE